MGGRDLLVLHMPFDDSASEASSFRVERLCWDALTAALLWANTLLGRRTGYVDLWYHGANLAQLRLRRKRGLPARSSTPLPSPFPLMVFDRDRSVCVFIVARRQFRIFPAWTSGRVDAWRNPAGAGGRWTRARASIADRGSFQSALAELWNPDGRCSKHNPTMLAIAVLPVGDATHAGCEK